MKPGRGMRGIAPAIGRAALGTVCAAWLAPAAAAQAPLFGTGEDTQHLLTLQTAFSCPLGHLAELYASLADATEVLDVMAVETEVLAICRARQERLQSIAQAEIELRRLLGIEDPARGAARVSIMEAGDSPAPLVLACPEPAAEPAAAAEQAEAPPEPEQPEAVPVPVLQAAARPAASPLPDLAAALLDALAEEPGAGRAGCEGWSWMWTGRDHARRHTALLVSPDGYRREVAIGDRLPSGKTVTAITPSGVVVDDGAGNALQLPAYGGTARLPTADSAVAEAPGPAPAEGEAR